jgi:hypothetical protein
MDFNHNGYKTQIVHHIMNALLRRKVFRPSQLTTLIQLLTFADGYIDVLEYLFPHAADRLTSSIFSQLCR